MGWDVAQRLQILSNHDQRRHAFADCRAELLGADHRRFAAARALGKSKRSFYDWLGEPVPVAPELGLDVEVLPDHRQADADRKRRDHEAVRELLDRGACKLDLPLDMESPLKLDPIPATSQWSWRASPPWRSAPPSATCDRFASLTWPPPCSRGSAPRRHISP
jgi:hypothetical protein